MVCKVPYSCDGNAGALESMQQSSADAARILKDSGATACTDVTGFGLLGHLVEMTRPSQVCILTHSSPATFQAPTVSQAPLSRPPPPSPPYSATFQAPTVFQAPPLVGPPPPPPIRPPPGTLLLPPPPPRRPAAAVWLLFFLLQAYRALPPAVVCLFIRHIEICETLQRTLAFTKEPTTP